MAKMSDEARELYNFITGTLLTDPNFLTEMCYIWANIYIAQYGNGEEVNEVFSNDDMRQCAVKIVDLIQDNW